MINLKEIQKQVSEWSAENFPADQDPNSKFMGVVEEVGELAHAILKGKQGIRGDKTQHRMEEFDAIGDILIYLCDYCTLRDFDLEEIIIHTWNQVKERNWKDDKKEGGLNK